MCKRSNAKENCDPVINDQLKRISHIPIELHFQICCLRKQAVWSQHESHLPLNDGLFWHFTIRNCLHEKHSLCGFFCFNINKLLKKQRPHRFCDNKNFTILNQTKRAHISNEYTNNEREKKTTNNAQRICSIMHQKIRIDQNETEIKYERQRMK